MPGREKAVAVAGHICIDITPVFTAQNCGKKIEELLVPGKLIQMDKADIHTGGAVANTGLALKLLGANVKLMGKIGADELGHLLLAILKKFDAATGMIVARDISTSYSVVIAIPGTDRIFLHNPGANDTFTAADILPDQLRNVALFHFGYPPLMKSMYQNNGTELVSLFKQLKEQGIATSLDMAAVDSSSEAGRANWKQILQNVLPYVDFFVPSVEEITYMLDRTRYDALLERAKGTELTHVLSLEKDVQPLADELIGMGTKVVLIKCGSPGMYYKTAGRKELAGIGSRLELSFDSWASREGFEDSYKPEKILSGTGAGDTSIAAFLHAMMQGYSLEDCLKLATATGACCVETYDALSGLQPFEQLLAKINSGWKKQNLKIL